MMRLEVYVELWQCGCRVVCLDGGWTPVVLGRLAGALAGLEVLQW